MRFRLQPSAYVGITLLAVLLVSVTCSKKKKTDSEELMFLNHHDSVAYVGMDICAQCHQEQHSTFVHTGMGSSFGPGTADKSSANFHNALVYDSASNLYYRAFLNEGKIMMMEFELDEVGDTVFQRTEAIDYVVGSGQHTNSHLMLKNGYVVQAPMTYYTQKGKWDLPPGFENGNNSRFTRIIDRECMSCHNSLPVMAEKSTRRFTHIGLGIDCERCHGPGQLHVQHRQKVGLKKTGKFDSTIVNPTRLSPELLIDLCQRCHLQGNNVLKPGKEFTDFKPGMKLSDVFEVYLPQYEGDHSEFNMADHSARLQMSKCFLENGNELTCISCHNPHLSVKATKKARFNTQCTNCHKEQNDCSLPLAEREKKANSCYTCHMPLSNSKDIPHVEIHDHRIQIPKKESKQTSRKLLGLYSVNQDKPSTSMLLRAYLSYYEKFDKQDLYLQKAEELIRTEEDIEGKIHLLFLRQNWEGLVSLANGLDESQSLSDAFSYYRLAYAKKIKNELVDAELLFKKAINLEPDRFDFLDELGNVYLKQNKVKQAIEMFEKSIEWYPFNAKAFNNLGYCLFLESDLAKARFNYEKALKLDHHYAPALENMARLFLDAGQSDVALQYLEKALPYSDDTERLKAAIKMIKKGNE